jgi:hypothetical protein
MAKIACHSSDNFIMKFILLLIIILLSSQPGCQKKLHADAPSCIKDKIRKIAAQPKWNPPATVTEYLYNGKKVYLFSSDCCDQYNELFDNNCTYLCAPSGGISGGGDRKCSDFDSKATFIQVIWKDPR